ncbi:hypothetical protein [Micromonospora maris]|uniref:hypothetical protein n=1 Tax=Micromonospora maris TaxID=1003110 RepID=UPI000206B43C|nr:hypothetical protein [Micromonospora maris]AEB45762.1 hypothetical protein VAB18032_23320 [Micromonospora maris AB-18-032]
MSQPGTANPFPSSAVARFSSLDADSFPTISTDAVRRATLLLDRYLLDGAVTEKPSAGSVVAIVGEYGTGKTHLALTMLRHLAIAGGVKSLYLDAPADSFLALYRERFIPRLSRAEVRRTVQNYYADIVAEDLEDSDLTRPMAQDLRARTVQPLALVRRVGLMEAKYQELLTERLRTITEDRSFGVALSMFLRPEFEAAAWEWLCGNPADTTLTERGVVSTLDTDANALQAMGVIALLYGGQQRRFVVVIDEMEKILRDSSATEEAEGVLAAFKRMLEIFSKTGALLILCGLPDFLEALPEDSRQRISLILKPDRLKAEDAIRYIKDVNEHSTGERKLHPFTTDVASYLADLSGGNARRLVRLCFYAYAEAAGKTVTRAIVREAAREQFEVVSQEDLRGDIARVLNRNGWRFETGRTLIEEGSKSKADYWIPAGDGGCAIFVTQSVLQEADANSLFAMGARSNTEKQNTSSTKSLLVINGYLSDKFRPALEQKFDAIVTHNLRTFSDDLEAALQGAISRIEKDISSATLETLSAKLEQSVRQNTQLRRSFDELAERLLGQESIQLAVERGMTSVFATLAGRRLSSSRFPEVDRIFTDAMRELDEWPSLRELHVGHVVNDRILRATLLMEGMRAAVEAFRDATTNLLSKTSDTVAIGELCKRHDGIARHFFALIDPDELNEMEFSLRRDGRFPTKDLLEHRIMDLGRDVFRSAIASMDRNDRYF